MALYTSQSLQEGVINAETFTGAVAVTMQFINDSSGGGGYFTVEASGSTTNPTDQNPLTDPNLTFVPSTSGGGSGIKINVIFTGGAGVSTLTSCNVLQGFQGSGYAIGDTLTIPAAQLNAKSGGSGTTDLIFTLERKDIIPQFDQSSQANVSGDFTNFSGEFNLEFPPNSGNITSGSGLIQSGNKWSIPIPPGPFAGGANNPKLTWRPTRCPYLLRYRGFWFKNLK